MVGYKFGLGRHNGSTRRTLRELVGSANAFALVLNIRNDDKLHKLFDKGRLASAHGADHAEVDISPRPLSNVLKDVEFFHASPSSR
ncbi:malonyl CoA-acyl carrier protein transacylase [Alicyclobacillus hesperidum URH17-3-68]|nr:malonyl CoA-acyl carrier protein transacylase [Alicyclobacillus hesperidum URH17-3-68]